jgi:hypothetical protein
MKKLLFSPSKFHFLGLLFVLGILAGCGPYYVDYFPYHNDGTRKPSVVLLPIIDRSQAGLCWDLKEELTEEFHCRAMSNANLFFVPDETVVKELRQASKERPIDYFGPDLSFTKFFCEGDFIVAIELIEHQWIPYLPGKISPLYPIKKGTCDRVLAMKARLKVIDIRDKKPRVVLMEIFNSNHMIARNDERVDYRECCWGSDPYTRTALSITHQRMIRDIVSRLEYVLLPAHSHKG